MHSELSELLEADRTASYCTMSKSEMNVLSGWVKEDSFKKDYLEKVKNTVEEELADVVIRVMDFCARENIDLEYHIKAKMRYNSLRPHKHGKKY